MLDIVWKDMAPTVAVVGIGLTGLRQYSKFTKAQRVVFQIGLVCSILGLSLFVVTQLMGLVSCKDIKAYV
ncbi:uncharacterized protein N7518_009642 [Penicillium psychrosexuale]|uniref:uncharacterized protein n=1 Tax=Penicillium psychrosexuale TaxID=1002107 RepID=UPI0025458AD9|nr:uncharacterized protein N7518_009642 [Penicillium psychrosexuale]KAJ5783965.1 hypothetical protein N7518_009642 [Penicillium psychrosexuale]